MDRHAQAMWVNRPKSTLLSWTKAQKTLKSQQERTKVKMFR